MGIGNSQAVQWLGLCTFTAKGAGSIPGWGTKIPSLAVRPKKKKQKMTGIILKALHILANLVFITYGHYSKGFTHFSKFSLYNLLYPSPPYSVSWELRFTNNIVGVTCHLAFRVSGQWETGRRLEGGKRREAGACISWPPSRQLEAIIRILC